VSAGTVDPAKVVRVTLQDAASGTPKKKEAPSVPGGGMGGMDY
jgi:hypothetical protein